VLATGEYPAMTGRNSTPTRRTFRLGPLSLVVEADAPFDLVAGWLPQTNITNDDAPAAAISVARDLRPLNPGSVPQFVSGAVQVWVDEAMARATVLTPTGHARVDFASRLARLHPGTDAQEAAELLSLTAALVLARAGTLVLEASAVIDTTGWCWLTLGQPDDRARLTRAFCADGGRFVSDGRVLVRRLPLKPEQIIVESWYQAAAKPSSAAATGAIASDAALPWDRWRPLSPLRGLLLAGTSRARTLPQWRSAERDYATTMLLRAVSCTGADRVATPSRPNW